MTIRTGKLSRKENYQIGKKAIKEGPEPIVRNIKQGSRAVSLKFLICVKVKPRFLRLRKQKKPVQNTQALRNLVADI